MTVKSTYWRQRDGQKKVGRFIKNDDDLLSAVRLTPFSFEEICESPYVETDNPSRNMIRSQLHRKEIINAAIREHATFNKDLRKPEHIPHLLVPIDFTQSWLKDRERVRDVDPNEIDEDELEFERAFHEKEMAMQQRYKRKPTKGAPEETKESATSPTNSKESAPMPTAEGTPAVTGTMVPGSPSEDSAKESSTVESAGQDPEDKVLDPIAANSRAESSPTKSQFIPLETGEQETPPERRAIDAYHQEAELKERNQERLKELFEEEKKKGYTEGYQHGEEKGALASEAKHATLIDRLKESVQQLTQVKKEILLGAQQSFGEILQALATTILKREISMNPDILGNLIEQAVKESMEDEKIKILVHPDTQRELSATWKSKLAGYLVASNDIEPGEFKIESNLSTVDGRISEIVESLVSKIDSQFLEDMEKAS